MRSKTRIAYVGFEIEGGWKGERGVPPHDDVVLITDGSINGTSLRDSPIEAAHVGECVSAPIPYKAGEEEPAWMAWLTKHWPDADPPNRTNNTCGLHIHISFNNFLDYSLMTSATATYAIRDAMMDLGKKLKLPKTHDFWQRINGGNQFCNFQTDPARQMSLKGKQMTKIRYGFMNYAFGVHGTVEFRALPTFRDAHIAVAFAEKYFDTVDDWLDANRPEEDTLIRMTKIFRGGIAKCV